MPSNKTIINNINIKLDKNVEGLKKVKKNLRKKKGKGNKKTNNKKKITNNQQEKPPFGNYQYPAPIIINPQQQKQLDDNYSKKLAEMMQKKFDEEYAKNENEKAKLKTGKNNGPQQVGAFKGDEEGNVKDQLNKNIPPPPGFATKGSTKLTQSTNDYKTVDLNDQPNNTFQIANIINDQPIKKSEQFEQDVNNANNNYDDLPKLEVVEGELVESDNNTIEVGEAVPASKNGKPKHYCEICGIYIENTPSSIRRHNETLRHRHNAFQIGLRDGKPSAIAAKNALDYFANDGVSDSSSGSLSDVSSQSLASNNKEDNELFATSKIGSDTDDNSTIKSSLSKMSKTSSNTDIEPTKDIKQKIRAPDALSPTKNLYPTHDKVFSSPNDSKLGSALKKYTNDMKTNAVTFNTPSNIMDTPLSTIKVPNPDPNDFSIDEYLTNLTNDTNNNINTGPSAQFDQYVNKQDRKKRLNFGNK